MHRQKGFAPIVVIVALLIISGLIGAVYLGKQTNKPTPIPQSTTSPTVSAALSPEPTGSTANWKTYTDDLYYYKLNYPDTYDVSLTPVSYLTSSTGVKIPLRTTDLIEKSEKATILIYGNPQFGFCEGAGCKEEDYTTSSGLKGKKYTQSKGAYYTFSVGPNNLFINATFNFQQAEVVNKIISSLTYNFTFKFTE